MRRSVESVRSVSVAAYQAAAPVETKASPMKSQSYSPTMISRTATPIPAMGTSAMAERRSILGIAPANDGIRNTMTRGRK